MGGWPALVCRVFLGGLFLFAGYLKLRDVQLFANAVAGFKILPQSLIAFSAYALPWVEIVMGLCLLVGIWTRAAATMTVLLLITFIAAVLSVVFRGLDTKCSCFGKVEWPCVGEVGYCQVFRNLFLIACAIPILRAGPGKFAVDNLREEPLGR
jgi:uncharacterized membrane protein YphA (DoxX/SURF4 family)